MSNNLHVSHLQIIDAAFTGYVLCLYYCSFLYISIYMGECVCTSILKCRIVLLFSSRLDKQVQLALIHTYSFKHFNWLISLNLLFRFNIIIISCRRMHSSIETCLYVYIHSRIMISSRFDKNFDKSMLSFFKSG